MAAPLDISNVDTDQILPARYLKRITRTGFEDALFAEWRKDADFVLNRPVYAEASVLVAGTDFGTGSSREHAVWALQDWGFRVVISARFGDIFRANCGNAGLLAAVVEEGTLVRLLRHLKGNPGATLRVDVSERTISMGSEAIGFDVDDYTAWKLMNGLDEIAITMTAAEAIDMYELHRSPDLPALPAPAPRREGGTRP